MAKNRSCVPIRTPTPPDYEIATDAVASMRPIESIAERLGLPLDPAHFLSFGGRFAKVDHRALDETGLDRKGRVIHVTAMTPTPKGSGKTLTTIALVDGLNRVLTARGGGQRATFVLRQPSQGPTLGMKGGACGGGYSQVLPMEDINLQFSGDFAAVTQVHNLIWSTLMTFINRKKNAARVNLDAITWPRVVDLCDRSLRDFQVAPDGKNGAGLPAFGAHTVITAASEIMATLGMASDRDDLLTRIERIALAVTADGEVVTVRDLGIGPGVVALLRLAIHPNLVQTLDGSPGFIHTGPFANIAHGNSSRIGLALARQAADLVVTEGGFAADLGAQKFQDLVLREEGIHADVEVIVASLRDLKHQGGATPRGETRAERGRFRFAPDAEAIRRGIDNLEVHIQNLTRYGLPVVVALNRFSTDDPDEIALAVDAIQERTGAPVAIHTGYAEGGAGGQGLAEVVLDALETSRTQPPGTPLYADADPIETKVDAIARTIYRAAHVDWTDPARRKLEAILERARRLDPDATLNVCMSKTQYSLCDDPAMRGVPPEGRPVTVTDVMWMNGAGWITCLLGDVMLMPGMNFTTAAIRRFELVPDPRVFGGAVVKNLD